MSQTKGGTKRVQTSSVDAVMAARRKAHKVFDALWMNGYMSRNAAYEWLAKELGWSRTKTHMAKMSRLQCKEVIEKVSSLYGNR